ncbi:MAG: hypothetical protein Q4G44_07880 [Alcaligenaceae bacterium]|nr:hypothetical protein [Alcaligenaceae bacterium]
MFKAFFRLIFVAAVVGSLLSACGSSSEIRRPVSNLNSGAEPQVRASQSAWGGNSGVQIYGTIDSGYGYSSTKTTITRPDGSRSTIRNSRSGLHSMGR